jgi:T4 superinfection immunity protein
MTESNIATLAGSPLGWLLWLAIGCVYWAPTLIGGTRHVRHLAPLVVINLLTGWTGIGWLVALVMAVWPVRQAVYAPVNGGPIR